MQSTEGLKDVFYYSAGHAQYLRARGVPPKTCRTPAGKVVEYTNHFYHYPNKSTLNQLTGYDNYTRYRKKALAKYKKVVTLGECHMISY